LKKVLIVDDAAFIRLSLRRIIEKSGFEVIGEAENGLAAVKLYRQLKPDIVTMDITMQELNGIDALKMIKSLDKNARIIMITSLGHKDKIGEAIRAGAVAFILKPFNESFIEKSLKLVTAKQ